MRNTDPPRLITIGVRRRDGYACVICGTTRGPLTNQHRVARGMGGTLADWINGYANLITLCGSGTTGCHGWVEAHPTFAREAGWSLTRTDDPTLIPVLYPEGWHLLHDDSTLTRIDVDRAVTFPPGARGHDRGSDRRWGETGLDPEVGTPWADPAARSGGTPDALRPWGSPPRR